MVGRMLLSLDGGGVRGLSELIILKQLMLQINPDNPPRPCEVFDLIGGTSTGGLIAVMLGRLEMSVDEVIAAYRDLSANIFKPKRTGIMKFMAVTDKLRMSAKFDTKVLEENIKSILRGRFSEEDAPMLSQMESRCKVFVCAVREASMKAVCLRSYRSKRGAEILCKIWEACRATSAAPGFFDPMPLGDFREEFVDGALGNNNPINHVYVEAKSLWPDDDILGVVSIGTGVKPPTKTGTSKNNVVKFAEMIARMYIDGERNAEEFVHHHPELISTKKYIRLNVSRGLESVALDDYTKLKQIAEATGGYLEDSHVQREIREFFISYKKAQEVSSSSTSLRTASSSESTIAADETDDGTITSHASFQSWLATFVSSEEVRMKELMDSEAEAPPIPTLNFLVRNIDSLPPPEAIEGADGHDTSLPTTQTIPFKYWQLRRTVEDPEKIHLIVDGLESNGRKFAQDILFDKRKTISELLQHLRKVDEGKSKLCGFMVKHQGQKYFIGETTKMENDYPVRVALKSNISTVGGSEIGLDERFIKFYNKTIYQSREESFKFILNPDHIKIVHKNERPVYLHLRRAMRVPDDNNTYSVSLPYQAIPLLPVEAFSSTLPASMNAKGGVFFPMLQREAVVLAFSDSSSDLGDSDVPSSFAVRVYAGSVNVLNGSIASHPDSTSEPFQDHIIVPGQDTLCGYRVKDDLGRQFIAMPMGDKYTAEFQLTGEEHIGGLQLEFARKLKNTVVFTPYGFDGLESEPFDLWSTPRDLGLKPGQLVWMQDTAMRHGPHPSVRPVDEKFLLKSFVFDHYGLNKNSHRGNGPDHRFTCVSEIFFRPPAKGKRAYKRYSQELSGYHYDISELKETLPTPNLIFDDRHSLVVTAIRTEELEISNFIDVERDERRLFSKSSIEISPFTPVNILKEIITAEFDKQLEHENLNKRQGYKLDVTFRKITINGESFDSSELSYTKTPLYRFALDCIGIRPIPIEVDWQRIKRMVVSPGKEPRFSMTIFRPAPSGLDYLDPGYKYAQYLSCAETTFVESSELDKGWDMGLAPGGYVKMDIVQDNNPEMWYWEGSRCINIQILNTVAFQAVTGIPPPVGLIPLRLPGASGSSLSWVDRNSSENFLARIFSVAETDYEKGCQLAVNLVEGKVVGCVCCEVNLADSLCIPCKHVFCNSCIRYYMTNDDGTTCGFCGAGVEDINQISGPSTLPRIQPAIQNEEHSIPPVEEPTSPQEPQKTTSPPDAPLTISPAMDSVLKILESEYTPRNLEQLPPSWVAGEILTHNHDFEPRTKSLFTNFLLKSLRSSYYKKINCHFDYFNPTNDTCEGSTPEAVKNWVIPLLRVLEHAVFTTPTPNGEGAEKLLHKIDYEEVMFSRPGEEPKRTFRNYEKFKYPSAEDWLNRLVDHVGEELALFLCKTGIFPVDDIEGIRLGRHTPLSSLRVIKRLVSEGASTRLEKGRTLLFYVNQTAEVEYLLREGVSIERLDDEGDNVLHYLAKRQDIGTLYTILDSLPYEYAVKLLARKNRDDRTPVDYVVDVKDWNWLSAAVSGTVPISTSMGGMGYTDESSEVQFFKFSLMGQQE